MLSGFFDTPTKKGYAPISLAALRLGMQIWIDLPWYKHPFPKNCFKLTTPKQLHTIRGLKLDNLYCHPTLSDPESAAVPDVLTVTEPMSLEALVEDQAATSEASSRRSPATPRVALYQANRLYGQTLRSSREALRYVADGQAAGAAGATAIVGQFTQQLVRSDASLGLADVMHLSGMDQVQAVHGLNTCLLALLVGRDLELTAEELTVLGLAGLMHDVGEQRLPSSIRLKTEPLTRAERDLFQCHPVYSQELIRGLPGIPADVADVVAQHHERLDRTGYPRARSASEIHPLAQIVGVVDEYQDLVTPRSKQGGLQPNQALSELYVKRQADLSLKVITALVRVLSVYPPGTLVELSDGAIGVVATVNAVDRLRPIVVVYEPCEQELASRLVDLSEQPELSILRMVHLQELAPAYLNRITPAEVLNFMLVADVKTSDRRP